MTDRNKAFAGSTIILSTTLILSLLLTMLRKGPSAFSTLSLAHMFVIFCFAGAIFYCVLKYRDTRIMVFSVFIVTLVHLLVFRITEPRYFIEFFLYYTALGASVLIYYKMLVLRMVRIRIGKFILLAAFLVIIYSAGTALVSVFSSGRSLSQSLKGILTVHSLTGITLGLGLEIGELLITKLLPEYMES